MYSWLLAAALALSPGGLAPTADDDTLAQVMALPPALREQFAQRVLAGRPSRRERLERIVDFVFDAEGLGMDYEDGATYTVRQAYATRKANCLGFTLLFLALLREAGLEASALVIDETLSWQRAEGLFYRNSHVYAEVRIGPRRFTLDVARDAVIARGRAVPLTPRRLLAHYHNNRAMELQARSELAAARRHMATALELDPAQPSHWSNAGVLALRAGDAAAARRAYEQALRLDPEHADALFNSVSLARRDGEREREAEFRARLARVQQQDPFHHFLQAIDYDRAGDLGQAIAHYRRATELHRGDHRLHAALADALQRFGDRAAARNALERAVALSDGVARAGYEARLQALRQTTN